MVVSGRQELLLTGIPHYSPTLASWVRLGQSHIVLPGRRDAGALGSEHRTRSLVGGTSAARFSPCPSSLCH